MLIYNLELALFDDIGKIHDQLGMIRSVIAKLANCARLITHPVFVFEHTYLSGFPHSTCQSKMLSNNGKLF